MLFGCVCVRTNYEDDCVGSDKNIGNNHTYIFSHKVKRYKCANVQIAYHLVHYCCNLSVDKNHDYYMAISLSQSRHARLKRI